MPLHEISHPFYNLERDKKFEIIGTTADAAVVAFGKSPQNLFANAAEGLTYVITDPDMVEKKENIEVEITGTDMENLLVKWLSEILYLFEVKEFIGKEFAVCCLNKNYLKARIEGEAFKMGKHIIKTEVKAVTYHQLALKHFEENWTAKIILDL